MASPHGPWVDVHAHPGRCFLAGLGDDEVLVQLLGSHTIAADLAAAGTAEMAAVSLATVADLAVLAPTPDGGLHAGRPFGPGEARADHDRQLAGILTALDALRVPVARTAADVERAHRAGQVAVLLTCEGADFLDGDLDGLAAAHGAGMSSLTLVHYRVNEVGDIQTEPPVHGGLTDFGRDVVRACNELGTIVDCAHATAATTLDVLEASRHPVMISHSHLDHADRSHPRLLADDHARAVADAGGLVGAWPSGVTSRTLDDFVEEIVRLVDLIEVDHVAVGTDLDANYRPVVTSYDQLGTVAARLGAAGLTPAEVDQVMGGNAVELLRTVAG